MDEKQIEKFRAKVIEAIKDWWGDPIEPGDGVNELITDIECIKFNGE